MQLSGNKNTPLRPLKRFGQNFLQDKEILEKIIEEINPQKNENIIEIGPGPGVLTTELVKFCPNLTLIEIDNRLIDELKAKYESASLIHGDILKFDFKAYSQKIGGNLRLVGNIPYNISSQILFAALESREVIEDIIIMLQLEVAQRIASPSNHKAYGILSVLIQSVADVKLCFKVPSTSFYPQPDVESAILHIRMKPFDSAFDFGYFKKVVKAAFSQRRKTLRNSLKSDFGHLCEESGMPIDLNNRAEQLTYQQFQLLAEYFKQKENQE